MASPTQRRLTAILSADVVGYSRLMERDEAGTLTRLKTLRQQEAWELLGHQARAAGRFLWQLSGEVLKKALEGVLTQGKS